MNPWCQPAQTSQLLRWYGMKEHQKTGPETQIFCAQSQTSENFSTPSACRSKHIIFNSASPVRAGGFAMNGTSKQARLTGGNDPVAICSSPYIFENLLQDGDYLKIKLLVHQNQAVVAPVLVWGRSFSNLDGCEVSRQYNIYSPDLTSNNSFKKVG